MLKISDIKASEGIILSPSIIASDLSVMGALAETMDPSVIDLIHMDVMDGHFVPNLTFGPGYVKALAARTSIPMDIHLMIEKPENTVDEYLEVKPWCVTFHYEATRFPARLLSYIKKTGTAAGLAVNPATPVESVYDMLPYADMVLVMSVDPGFYGQSFMDISLKRINRLSEFAEKEGFHNLLIQVDGGINEKNIASVRKAGADIFVAGGSVFKGVDINASAGNLKKAACSG